MHLITEHSLRVTAMLSSLVGGAHDAREPREVCLVGPASQRDLLHGLRHRLRLQGHAAFVTFHDVEEERFQLRLRARDSVAVLALYAHGSEHERCSSWAEGLGLPVLLVPFTQEEGREAPADQGHPELRRGRGHARNAFFVLQGETTHHLTDWLHACRASVREGA